MYIDDIKVFARNEKEVDTWIYKQGIGINSGIKECTMLTMKRE